MNRYPVSSPRHKDPRPVPPEEKDLFILNLQSKLQTLESNYLKFMEKFSDLLQTEELKTEARELLTEQSSSFNFSQEKPLFSLEDQEKLLSLLENIKTGKYLKQHMNEVTNLSNKTQDSLISLLKTEKISADKIKNLVSLLKRYLWESLIQKEEFTKNAVSVCIQRLNELTAIIGDSQSANKYKKKLKEYEEKQLKLTEENDYLQKQVIEQTECLNKIKSDYSEVRKNIEKNKSPSKFGKSEAWLSRSSSPEKYEEEIKRLKELNQNLNIKLKMMSHQNSVLQKKRRSVTNSGSRLEVQEHGQREIQEQLNNLKTKICGFEQIAKNLIDTSPKQENHSERFLKRLIETSPDLSIRSPMSMLEYESLQKNIRLVEKEKNSLAGALKIEKNKSEEILKELKEKTGKIRVLEDDLLRVQTKLLENNEKMESVFREKDELEFLVKDLDVIKQEFEGKIAEKESQVNGIEMINKDYLEKIKRLEEEKTKYAGLVGQHAENQKRLEETIKKWAEEYSKLQDVIETNKELEKKQAISQISSSFNRKIEELEKKLRETSENEKVALSYSKSLKEELEKIAKDYKETNEKLKKIEADNKKSVNEELENIEKALENTQREYKRIKNEYEGFKKTSEKIISDKDRIISSFEMKNHENFKLTGEVTDLQKNVEVLEEKLLDLSNENEVLNEKICCLSNKNESQEKTIENYENENKENLKKIKILNDQVKDLENNVFENSLKAKNLEEINKKSQVSIEKLQEKVKQLIDRQKTDEELISSNKILIFDQQEAIKRLNSAISEKENAKTVLKSELDQKVSEISQINEESLSLKTVLSSSEKEKIALNYEVKSLNEQISFLEKSNSEKSSMILTYQSSQKDLNVIEANLKRSLQAEFDSKFKEKAAEVNSLTQELREKKNLIEKLEHSLEELKENLNKTQFDLEGKEKIIENLKKRAKKTEDLNFTLKQSLSSNEENLFEVNNSAKKLKSEIENIAGELNEAQLKIQEKSAVIESLKNELAALREAQKTETSKNLENLKDSEVKLKEARNELNDLKLLNNELSQKLSETSKSLQKEIEKLRSKESSLNENIEGLSNENIKINSLLIETQINLKNSRKQFLNARDLIRNFKFSEVKVFFKEFKDSVFAELNEFKNTANINEIILSIDSAVVLMKAHNESEKKELLSSTERLLKKLDSANREKQHMENEIVSLKDSMSHLESETSQLKAQAVSGERLRQAEIEKEDLLDKLKDCENKVEALKLVNKDLQNELTELRQSVSITKQLHNNGLSELENYQIELSSVKKLLSDSTQQHNHDLKTLEDLQNEKKTLAKFLSEAEQQQNISRKNIEDLQSEKNSLTKLLSETDQQRKADTKIIEDLRSEQVSLKKQLSEFNQSQNSDLKTIENLQSEKNALKKQLSETEQEAKNYKTKTESLQSEQTSLKSLLSKSEEEHKNDLKKIENLESTISYQKQDIESYTAKILEKTQKVESLSELIDQLSSNQDKSEYEKQLLIKKQELRHLNQENQTLQSKLEDKNKAIEDLSKSQNLLKYENERLSKDLKSCNKELQKNIEKLEDKENAVKRLEETVSELEKLLKSSEITEGELRKALERKSAEFDPKNFKQKPFVSKEEDLPFSSRQRLSIQVHSDSGHLTPIMTPSQHKSPNKFKSASPAKSSSPFKSPNPETSQKSNSRSSVSSNPNGKESDYTDELNITPCKVLKVVKVGEKKWVLCRNEKGSFIWKDENVLHISGADNLLEPEEDITEIRNALGEFFKGTIVETIQHMKEKLEKPDVSAQFCTDEKLDLASHSFRFEILDAGLDLSKIDIKLQDPQDYDQVSKELSQTRLELESKTKKIEEKKRKISLFKDQISVFKEQIRKEGEARKELEIKIKSNMAVNLPYLKQIFTNLISKIKSDKNLEDLIAVLYKILEFSQDDIARLQLQRGAKVLKK